MNGLEQNDNLQVEACLGTGAAIGCWQGDVLKVQDDAAALKPALMVRFLIVLLCSIGLHEEPSGQYPSTKR